MESPYVSIASFFVLNCPVCTYSKNCAVLFGDHKTSAHRIKTYLHELQYFQIKKIDYCDVD